MLQGLQVVVQGLRHPFQALAGSVAQAVSHGRTSEISAAAQRLYLRPVVLRTAAELARRHPGALAALNVAAVQDGRESAVARLARDLLQHGGVGSSLRWASAVREACCWHLPPPARSLPTWRRAPHWCPPCNDPAVQAMLISQPARTLTTTS